jgi:uncharacterized protein (TIGR02118 family)
MICVTAFYPAAGESRFDATYYFEKHCPMVKNLLTPFGLTKMEIDEGLSGFGPGTPPNYKIACRMYFENIEGFQAGVAAVGNQIFADIPNYTDIPVEVQVSALREV